MNALRIAAFLVVCLIVSALALPLSDNVLPEACSYLQIGSVAAQGGTTCDPCRRGNCDTWNFICRLSSQYLAKCSNCTDPEGWIYCDRCSFI
jgi:hypothetical protein